MRGHGDANRASDPGNLVGLREASQFDVLAALCGFRTGSQTAVDLVKHVPARPLNDATAIVEGWLA